MLQWEPGHLNASQHNLQYDAFRVHFTNLISSAFPHLGDESQLGGGGYGIRKLDAQNTMEREGNLDQASAAVRGCAQSVLLKRRIFNKKRAQTSCVRRPSRPREATRMFKQNVHIKRQEL